MNKIQNEGKTDRIIRIVLGLIALLVLGNFSGVLKIIAGIIAVILIVTGITGFCAIYKIFGIKTNKK